MVILVHREILVFHFLEKTDKCTNLKAIFFFVNGFGLTLDSQSKQFFKDPEMPLLYSGVDITTAEAH